MAYAPLSRRDFLGLAGPALVALAVGPLPLAGPRPVPRPVSRPKDGVHPAPRAGIDGSRVLPADRVPPHVADLFDRVRAIPGVVDGIGCRCGCGEVEGMYSLLSCYEGAGMAQYCEICQGEGRLVTRLHDEGRTLNEIRGEVDRRFG